MARVEPYSDQVICYRSFHSVAGLGGWNSLSSGLCEFVDILTSWQSIHDAHAKRLAQLHLTLHNLRLLHHRLQQPLHLQVLPVSTVPLTRPSPPPPPPLPLLLQTPQALTSYGSARFARRITTVAWKHTCVSRRRRHQLGATLSFPSAPAPWSGSRVRPSLNRTFTPSIPRRTPRCTMSCLRRMPDSIATMAF